jgi:hypothetical protein
VKPVKPLDANMVYKGPTPDVGDLECTRVKPGHIRSEWRLSEDEISWLAAGGNVQLEILNEPIPPIALNVVEPYCPECMVAMELQWRDIDQQGDFAVPTWRFRCTHCRRWA